MSNAPLILVIDDELQIQRALRKILAENGCRVMTAATGEEGLALAAATPPDAVILDLGLPDMDGAVVCEKLRAWTQTPILILSARDDQRIGFHLAEGVEAIDPAVEPEWLLEEHRAEGLAVGSWLQREPEFLRDGRPR